MASTIATLPPMGKLSMIGIWVETLLYGVNCVFYGLCMLVLLRQKKTVPLRWLLIVTSTILFVLATAHIGASLHQLLEAFVYAPADVPEYSSYWDNLTATPRVLKNNLYGALVLVQHFIMIWRLYVVFMLDWRIVVLPTILSTSCIGCAFAASATSLFPSNLQTVTPSLLVSAWAFGFTFNVSVTAAIVGRLWWMGRKTVALTDSETPGNRFATSIYVIIESGAISAIASTVVLALSAVPAALTGLDIVFQPVALTPLLVVVQVATYDRYRTSGVNLPTSTQESIAFRVRTPREADSWKDESRPASPLSPSTSSAHDARV